MQELGVVFVVLIVGIAILAIVGFIWQQKKNAEREQAFGRIAAANGLQYITQGKSYARGFDDGEKPFRSLGFARLDIGDPDFDDTFKIRSDSEQFGRRVLHPAVIDLLRQTGPWDWRFSGQNMISYDQGVLEPEYALPRLNMMCDLLDRIPADAWTGA